MFFNRSCPLAALGLLVTCAASAAIGGQGQENQPATIIVRVPAAAKLFIDDVRSSQTGPTRKIVTDPLEPGYKYSYTLRIEVDHEGQPTSMAKKVHFLAGQTTTVDFSDFGPKKNKTVTEKQPATEGFKLSRGEKELLELLNKERDKEGLAPFTANPKLFQAARDHTANMAKQDRLEHSLDGKSPGDRIDATGYVSGTWGENIAAGQRSPAEAVISWMNSEGHRANILSGQFTEIGIGIVASDGRIPYYTLVFARPRGK